MPIDTIILKGIGSSPGNIGYVVTHGFGNLAGGGPAPEEPSRKSMASARNLRRRRNRHRG